MKSLGLVSTADVPAKPQAPILFQRPTGGILIAWKAPEDHGAQIIEHILHLSIGNDDNFQVYYKGPICESELDTASFGEKYFFKVQAVNVIGMSPCSECSSITFNQKPHAAITRNQNPIEGLLNNILKKAQSPQPADEDFSKKVQNKRMHYFY